MLVGCVNDEFRMMLEEEEALEATLPVKLKVLGPPVPVPADAFHP